MQYTLAFFKKIWASKAVKRKLAFTALIFAAFRLLAAVPLPGVDTVALKSFISGSDLFSLLNVFSGGTLVNFSIVAVGINAYITASIIMQLAGLLIPKIKELQKEGEQGREQVNSYTRMLAVPLAVFQSISVLVLLRSQGLLVTEDPITIAAMVATLVAGSQLVMWLGEQVTRYGAGNGISMILLAGILSQIPVMLSQFGVMATGDQMTVIIFGAILAFMVMLVIVFMNEAVRRIPVQYARRVRGSRTYGGQMSFLPIKVNVTGVLPIIFAVTLMILPSFASQIFLGTQIGTLQSIGRWLTVNFSQTSTLYMIVYFLIVFVFTYFSALVFFNADDLSKELKKSGAFVPGIRPGAATKKHLEFVVTRITLVGATFLGLIAILPIIAQNLTGIQQLAIGGTSVLIVVSVILETAKQLDSFLLEHNYDKYA